MYRFISYQSNYCNVLLTHLPKNYLCRLQLKRCHQNPNQKPQTWPHHTCSVNFTVALYNITSLTRTFGYSGSGLLFFLRVKIVKTVFNFSRTKLHKTFFTHHNGSGAVMQGTGQTIRSSLGLTVGLKGTLTCGQQELRIKKKKKRLPFFSASVQNFS